MLLISASFCIILAAAIKNISQEFPWIPPWVGATIMWVLIVAALVQIAYFIYKQYVVGGSKKYAKKEGDQRLADNQKSSQEMRDKTVKGI